MNIVWDEPKRVASLEKHGLDFADVDEFGWSDAVIASSYARRFKAIGLFRTRIVVVIYSLLGSEAISIVGMRRAGVRERRLYEKQEQHQEE
ncbi:MAG TPA: BrnT family toxin [Bauldia sp.]|nr:BrnT family toxin [Bauldia sp.]